MGNRGRFSPGTELAIEVSKGPVRRGFWVCRCGKRCAVVYRKPHGDSRWLCRECAGWRYASEALHSNGNGRYKRLKLQFDRLAGIIGPDGWHCPRRMRSKTWEALNERLQRIREQIVIHAMRNEGSGSAQKWRRLSVCLTFTAE